MPYFSAPSDQLDPNLFQDMQLWPEIRAWLLATLENGLRRYLNLDGAHEWLHVWLAGSGITYQWEGNTDLDVLFGVDMQRFVHWNPEYSGLPESYVADRADEVLRQKLWPKTAHQQFGSQQYEVTFFWAPGTGSDITRIHPYAAYDLMKDSWVVQPPSLPHDPRSLYPSEWYQAADRDVDAAETLARRHGNLRAQLSSTLPDKPEWRNAWAELTRVQLAAMSLFMEIHGGRREAFGEQGRGYGDWHNFRWQRGKETGIVAALMNIMSAASVGRAEEDERLYGGPIDGPQAILTRDMLNYGRHDR